MIKKTIKFTDYDGNERTKDYWFNLNRRELTEMEMRQKNGMEAMLKKMVEEEDRDRLIDFFKELIEMSIGEKSEYGQYFFKDPDIVRKFKASEAYTELWLELINNTEAAVAFVNGIIPQDIAEKAAEAQQAANVLPMA